jgi:mRNA interferase HigB
MRIIAKRTLREFWTRHPQAEAPLDKWYSSVSDADWNGPADVKKDHGSADFIGDNRVIFNIGGNKFRLIVFVFYRKKQVLIKFIGTHAEYNKIDAETV